MASNLFGRYVWLVDLLRRYKRLTFEEINEHWIHSGLSYGEDDTLPLRTFHNHRKAIRDIFEVDIECDTRDGYRYYIEHPEWIEGDSLRSWFIHSYATLNQVVADQSLRQRILFESMPSGDRWLTTFTEAMRMGRRVEITHQGFGKQKAFTFKIDPYYLKVFKQRWYVIGKNPHYEMQRKATEAEGKTYDGSVYRVYALDRISAVHITAYPFTIDEDFDIVQFYAGCCGVVPASHIAIEHIVLRATGTAPDYLRSLPFHSSQKEERCTDGTSIFSMDICPTFEFYQMLLSQGNFLEVVTPLSIRRKMQGIVEEMHVLYEASESGE